MTSDRARGSRLLLEALVVIASILIAFALDAWWDQRAERRTEAAHLRALQSDFEQNVARLERAVRTEQRIAEASRGLLLLASTSAASPSNDSLSVLMARVFTSTRFDPVMGAYAAVVSSGGLAQIRDDSLRLALADFASYLEGRYFERYSDQLYFDFVQSFTGQLGLSEAVLATDSSAALRKAGVSQAHTVLLQNPKFREHLALRYLAESDVAGSYRGLLEKANRVLELTRRALGD
jgi:hypothetical protein